jgi:hypothetical protein
MTTLPKDLIPWLHEQLAKAERSLRAREQMEAGMRQDPDELFKKLAAMPGVTITTRAPRGVKVMTKKERLASADSHRRIGAKDRRDVELFKAVIAALTP